MKTDRCMEPDCRVCSLARKYRLTPRHLQIIALLCLGLNNTEMPRTLGCRSVTLKVHLQEINRRLGTRSRLQVALWAVRNGIGG